MGAWAAWLPDIPTEAVEGDTRFFSERGSFHLRIARGAFQAKKVMRPLMLRSEAEQLYNLPWLLTEEL